MSRIDGEIVVGLLAIVAVVLTIFSFVSLLWVTGRRRMRGLPTDFLPPITIYKPLKGVDEGLEDNLRTFFELDYPAYQLLFGVADKDDPAIAVVNRLIAEFPGRDARLVVGFPVFGLNPKVENLAALEPHRKYDVILISDSNVQAHPAYLRETVCYLADPSVGLVTNLFAGIDELHAGAALENLHLNGFIAGGFAAATVTGATCVVGKSMLMPVRVLEAVGGLGSVRNVLAEDQVIGLKVRKAGYAIRLSHHVIGNVNSARTLRWFLNRHSRWYKIRRRLALPAFLIEPLTNLTAVGLVWALSANSPMGWWGLLALWALTILRDAVQTRWLRGSFPRLRHLPLCLVKDLFLLPVWLDALVDQRINWRGHRFLIGRYTRLRPPSSQFRAPQRPRMRRRHRTPPGS